MLRNIDVNRLKQLSNIKIIDIRDNRKYNDGHILNAINILSDDLLINYNKYLNKNDVYYIYCQKGNKSKQICSYLVKMNYNVININGGYEAWILDN